MADQLAVDLDALDDFGSQLDSIKKQLDSSRDTIDSYDDAYGSDKIRDAMHHFESHWHDGRKHVEDSAGVLANMAHEAVKSIRNSDQDLAKKLKDGVHQQAAK
ncbi:hypothetical protein KGQ20_23790 [Catenulispora sp. NF23]|uniref:WXG100 family type VII secretion target n=1 Tax=Catenulispora pinistramenti TaxID=2705254 RepID=A0ABS5L200_9ACTN|nr:hypothetical protein [Catenulispora pinistramenti]MBS2535789.1 hypothetical protein [Catenulispora pinistramenti]MBS2552274.1 hypothetical protein [Catenulispora pinistramenti]